MIPYRGRVQRPLLEREAIMAKDPVCGMEVDPSEAAAIVEHNGVTYYFCSQDCADSFQDDPDSYV
jgi:YHS domain-containing protein